MQPPEGHAPPHEPAPPEARRLVPEGPLLLRGLALVAVAVASLAALVAIFQKAALLGALLAPVLGLTALIAAWSAAIHLTGGQRFDDHPWV